jgi:DNA ligase-1
MKTLKPMLACDCGDTATLTFPLLASPKLDGVRAIVMNGGLMSRSLKRIPNVNVQNEFEGLPIGLDGELIAGDPCAPDAYRKTVSMVMAEDKPITGLVYHVFDRVGDNQHFSKRLLEILKLKKSISNPAVTIVPHFAADNHTELMDMEQTWVQMGYEGAMLRDPRGPYKFGRSTRKEGYLLKLKRFADSEAEVLGVVELMHNGNEAKTNALGRTERSTHKAGKTGLNTLGALKVRDITTGVEFEIGTGFTAEERRAFWLHSLSKSPWNLVKYKYFPSGSKDKPRFPVFLGWRDKRDT